ncbi:MAG: DNA-directed RNA polymerase subunit alpha [candidate division Zixibacteria bacterium RBG_16_53_22]|nr:MAG: DNA-directed RNA polymerase subunit alpha [candidate division Zixibacteria bacterium RBG_16_53_22]
MKWKSMQMPKEVALDEKTATPNYGRFIIEPLERGFGHTLGTTFRRVLLSSIQGAAVTAIRINGILHEFSAIPGVFEDITEIALNVKRLRLKHLSDESKTIVLTANSKGNYKAGDIETDPNIQIFNPDLHLVTLNDDVKFRMELDIDVGRGFVPADQNKKPGQPAGTIYLDTRFSPIIKVNYNVEDTRVGQRTDYDKLTLEVWTDGTITPDEALTFAAKLIRDHLNIFAKVDQEMEIVEEEKIDEEVMRIRNLLKMRVDELELSVRSSNCLHAANIVTLEDLVRKSEGEMLKYRNFGRKSLNELNQILGELGLSFGMDVDKFKEQEVGDSTLREAKVS